MFPSGRLCGTGWSCLQPEIVSRDVYFRTNESNGDTEESNKKKGGVLNSFLTYYILDK
jgi:hypothetical protein